MFGRKHGRRSTNILFVMFRLILSVVMFTVLLAGLYSAYKHFSGLDPLKLDPQSVAKNLLESRTPQQFLAILSSLKTNQSLGQTLDRKVLGQDPQKNSSQGLENLAQEQIAFKFLIVADSHNDNTNLRKAITQVKQAHPDLNFIIGLGDYTDVGTIDELKLAKVEFDNSALRYFLIPGDHDLWDSRNRFLSPNANFREVFGPSYQSFNLDQFKFLLLFNSDNYSGMDEEQLKWLSEELEKAKINQVKGIFVFVHEPLFHPSSDHVMGRVDNKLKQQAKILAYLFKDSAVKKVFAGDTHYFSEYSEPDTKLEMMTVGAVASERNPQTPRFGIVYIFEDGNVKVEDVEIR